MKIWLKTALLVLFVYLPTIAMAMAGFSVFGLGITIVSGLLLITNTEVRTWIHSKKGFRKRLSRLPLISLHPARNNAIIITVCLFGFSLVSWLILGGTHAVNLGVDFILSTAGVVLLYGLFVEGWFLNDQSQVPEPEEDKLASLIPDLSVAIILALTPEERANCGTNLYRTHAEIFGENCFFADNQKTISDDVEYTFVYTQDEGFHQVWDYDTWLEITENNYSMTDT